MAPNRLSRQYRRQSDANLLKFSNFIYQQMSSQSAYFSNSTPTMVVFKEGIDEFQSAKNAAGDGGRLLIRQKNVQRRALIAMLDQLCSYVEFIAGGDVEIVAKAGFPFVKPPENRSISVPTDLQLVAGNQPGEIEMSIKAVRGAGSYVHQYTDDPELKESSWISTYCTSTKCLITGLTPGTLYYFRVGAVGSREQILYSSVVSKMAA